MDPDRETTCAWDHRDAGMETGAFVDLLTGKPVSAGGKGHKAKIRLEPGQVLCLSPNPADLERIAVDPEPDFHVPARIERQQLRAQALDVHRCFTDTDDLADFDPDRAAADLRDDPIRFFAAG